jgi:hypothetical protein
MKISAYALIKLSLKDILKYKQAVIGCDDNIYSQTQFSVDRKNIKRTYKM